MKKENINEANNSDLESIIQRLNYAYDNYHSKIEDITKYPIEEYSNTVQNLFKTGIFEKKVIKLKDYLLINEMHSIIYKEYYKDSKCMYLEQKSTQQFKDFFVEKLSKESDYYSKRNWEVDKEYQVSRKNSEKALFDIGNVTFEESLKDTQSLYLKSSVLVPKYDLRLSGKNEKFFWIYGNTPKRNDILIRVYFNFYPKEHLILNLLKILKNEFNEKKIPFAFKFLSDPEIYKIRSDCGVLYFSRKHALFGFKVLDRIIRELGNKRLFSSSKPKFTLKIADGISFGEDPHNPIFSSFGSYRAAAISISYFRVREKKMEGNIENLISELNLFNLEEKKDRATSIEKSGLSLFPIGYDNDTILSGYFDKIRKKWFEQFHLNPTSAYKYEAELNYIKAKNSKKKQRKIDCIYAEYAKRIGILLVSEAEFYPVKKNELECNWVSFSHFGYSEENISSINLKVLDRTFEKGSLGISFLLKKLYDVFPENKEFDTTFYRATKNQIFRKGSNLTDIEKWFVYNTNYHYFKGRTKFKSINPQLICLERKNNLKNLNLIKFLDRIISEDSVNITAQNSELLKQFEKSLKLFIEEDKPFEEISQTKEFKPDLNLGLAYIGYACLRLCNATKYPSLPLSFDYND